MRRTRNEHRPHRSSMPPRETSRRSATTAPSGGGGLRRSAIGDGIEASVRGDNAARPRSAVNGAMQGLWKTLKTAGLVTLSAAVLVGTGFVVKDRFVDSPRPEPVPVVVPVEVPIDAPKLPGDERPTPVDVQPEEVSPPSETAPGLPGRLGPQPPEPDPTPAPLPEITPTTPLSGPASSSPTLDRPRLGELGDASSTNWVIGHPEAPTQTVPDKLPEAQGTTRPAVLDIPAAVETAPASQPQPDLRRPTFRDLQSQPNPDAEAPLTFKPFERPKVIFGKD